MVKNFSDCATGNGKEEWHRMPELPEVETIARGLAGQLVGSRIMAVQELRKGMVEGDRERFFSATPGAVVTSVGRRGKLLLLHLSGEKHPECLAFHLKMSGRLFVYPQDAAPGKHTRVLFDLEDGRRLFFDDARTFGFCRILDAAEKNSWTFWKTLGPEPLEITPESFVRLFRGARRAIKAMLLDQTVIAGIGNIYADESLFRARIRPDAPGGRIARESLVRLHGEIQAVLLESIEQCGSSIRDYRDAHGNAGAFQNVFQAYGRAGQACLRCGASLQCARIAGRTTVFCAQCQKME